MLSINEHHPLRRLFAGLVEQAFCAEAGVCDPGLTDYLADLLVDFTHVDRLNAIRNAADKRPEHVAEMLAVLSDEPITDPTDRERSVHRSIGDYTLFWAGVYPEQLRGARRRRSGDVLFDYVTQGKRSYLIAAKLSNEDGRPPPSLFRHLSEEFEFCLYGLGLVRRGLEHAGKEPGGGHATLLY